MYAKVPNPSFLKTWFAVVDEEPFDSDRKYYVGKVLFRTYKDFLWYTFRMHTPAHFVEKAPHDSALWIGRSYNSRLHYHFESIYKQAQENEMRARRAAYKGDERGLHAIPGYTNIVRQKVEKGVVLLDLFLITLHKEDKRQLEELLRTLSNLKNLQVKWSILKGEDILRHPYPKFHKSDYVKDLFALPGLRLVRLHSLKDEFDEWFLRGLPNPKTHAIEYVRGSALPSHHVEKPSEEECIYLGRTPEYTDVYISIPELYRHMYLVGPSGYGKSTVLKLLALTLAEKGYNVVVLDPHGDLAIDLYRLYENAILLHPSPKLGGFSINPLDLPPASDPASARSIAVDNALSLFMKILNLPEQAVYVRFVLQTVLRYVYERIENPSFAMLYKLIKMIYAGAELPITHKHFRENVMLLRKLPDQTFMSVFARLEFFEEPIVKMTTSTTTFDFNEYLTTVPVPGQKGQMILFAVPKSDVGELQAGLICATILMKLWHFVLARARLNKPRTPIFVIIDEFQTLQALPVISTILSEARKFGLHLIIAHQNITQLQDPELRDTVLANTGVKLIFRTQNPEDLRAFREIDSSFAKEIASELTSLGVGHAVLIRSANPGEQQPPPVRVMIAFPQLTPVRSIVRFKEEYTPPSVDEINELIENQLAQLISPALKYATTYDLWLYYLVEIVIKNGGEMSTADLYALSPLGKNRFEDLLKDATGKGFLEVAVRRDRRYVKVSDEFYKVFERNAPSDIGKKIIRTLVNYYASKGYLVIPGAPTNGPDAIVIPVIGATFDCENAFAAEVEALKGDKHHIVHTLTKESSKALKKVVLWIPLEKVTTVYEVLKNTTIDDVEWSVVATDGEAVEVFEDLAEMEEYIAKAKHEHKLMDEFTIEPKSNQTNEMLKGLIQGVISIVESLDLDESTKDQIKELLNQAIGRVKESDPLKVARENKTESTTEDMTELLSKEYTPSGAIVDKKVKVEVTPFPTIEMKNVETSKSEDAKKEVSKEGEEHEAEDDINKLNIKDIGLYDKIVSVSESLKPVALAVISAIESNLSEVPSLRHAISRYVYRLCNSTSNAEELEKKLYQIIDEIKRVEDELIAENVKNEGLECIIRKDAIKETPIPLEEDVVRVKLITSFKLPPLKAEVASVIESGEERICLLESVISREARKIKERVETGEEDVTLRKSQVNDKLFVISYYDKKYHQQYGTFCVLLGDRTL
jgi:energy-coupling factor transporter ATP-binding protein EcfA2